MNTTILSNHYNLHGVFANPIAIGMLYWFGDDMLCKTNINALKEFEIDVTFKKVKVGNDDFGSKENIYMLDKEKKKRTK